MKIVFILFLFFSAVNAQANDTLTRAQVYNFNVSDTFDYRISNTQGYYGPDTSYSNTQASYSRYVVLSIYYSLDSATKYILCEELFPQGGVYDTATLSSLSGYEAYLDTSSCFYDDGTITEASTSPFGDSIINTLTDNDCHYNQKEYIFAKGLGLVLNVSWFYVHDNSVGDSTRLVYHSSGSGNWGTPYYNFTTGTQQVEAMDGRISLFPTLNDGTFNVKITDASLLPLSLMVYDIMGREVKETGLNSLNNNVSIEPCSSGIYIWKTQSGGNFVQSGKMVVN